MQTTFLNAAGTVLFVREDMEQGNWTQEEYTVNATFPYDAGKVIQRGMRIAFRDPATNNLEFFEILNVTNTEPDHAQQITAESIAVSELSDEHCQAVDITNKTAAQALTTVLAGTLWSMGTSEVSASSSVKLSRGSVWQNVLSIQTNWNCYVVPRVTVDSSGAITGRYLDVVSSGGVWRGVRLSLDKNMSDSSIVYDGSEIVTAMYGYGGTVDVAQQIGDDQRQELTFADVVWTATASHPAKPSGQTWLEWPEKTALYGRNGRPRYGYYQNSEITDATILLEKTWEALQKSAEPKISITGTVSDLYRLGYNDQPMRLHDIAIVEIRETGEVFRKQIIRLNVDLIDPTATRPEIGNYIPNIVYIADETNRLATGGRGGGGGGKPRGKTDLEDKEIQYGSDWIKTDAMIGMVVGTKNGSSYIKAASITASINASTGETFAQITADHITMEGETTIKDLLSGVAEISVLKVAGLTASQATVTQLAISGQNNTFTFGGHEVIWKTYDARYPTLGTRRYFLYSDASGNTTPTGTTRHYPITSYTDVTLHYLGRAPSA